MLANYFHKGAHGGEEFNGLCLRTKDGLRRRHVVDVIRFLCFTMGASNHCGVRAQDGTIARILGFLLLLILQAGRGRMRGNGGGRRRSGRKRSTALLNLRWGDRWIRIFVCWLVNFYGFPSSVDFLTATSGVPFACAPLHNMLWVFTVSACSFGSALGKVLRGIVVSTGTVYVVAGSVETVQLGSRFLILSTAGLQWGSTFGGILQGGL